MINLYFEHQKNGLMKKIFLILLFSSIIYSQEIQREFRGAWVASVANLDWPSSPNLSVEKQKEELISLLNKLAELKFNAVLFQVRPECDALYSSSYEPWSFWLTGKQGKAPEPFYDPLELAINEAHKRGLELHAWLNPYRAERSIDYFPLAENHIAVTNPEYILEFPKKKILNPGLPEVREFVANVVLDIVKRYDVDGIHFDDYFYPYPTPNTGFNGVTIEDAKTFSVHNRGYKDINEWRRSNVDLLIEMVNDSIKAHKPHVRFGVSPFGIWKNGIPHDVKGFSAFDKIYCDPLKWLNDKTIDYLAPQLYWPIEGDQSFYSLFNWWNSVNNGIDIFPGVASYRLLDKDWPTEEIINQLNIVDTLTSTSKGYIFFRAEDFHRNTKNIGEEILNTHHKNYAVTNTFYKSVEPSQFPKIKNSIITENSIIIELDESAPNEFFILYSFINKNKVGSILKIAGNNKIEILKEELKGSKYLALKKLNKYKILSNYSKLIKIINQ